MLATPSLVAARPLIYLQRVKIFVSSLIAGQAALRSAARKSIETLRHSAIMTEDLDARAQSPQIACLSEVRNADLMILILGEQYGDVQPSGRSATHEEYLAAQGNKPVLVFLQEGVSHVHAQADFIREVSGREHGLFRASFRTVDDFERALIRALIDHERASTSAPLDEAEITGRSISLLPQYSRNSSSAGLAVSIACGPKQHVLRPSELEDADLVDALHQQALFGNGKVFDQAKGVERGIDADALVIRQDGDAKVQLDTFGGILVLCSLGRDTRGSVHSFSPCILEEDVRRNLAATLELLVQLRREWKQA